MTTGARGSTEMPKTGGSAGLPHIPVMLTEVIDALAPAPGDIVIDGTFGAGGYSRAVLERGALVIAIDRDPSAIAGGASLLRQFPETLRLIEGRFADLDRLARDAGYAGVDGVVLDVGVSSMQVDTAARGFSFRHDGPLDMRMGGEGPTAANVVNRLGRSHLTRIFGILGEERRAPQVAGAIVKRRESRPFTNTADLAEVIAGATGASARIHPATRCFQALRIFLNRELEELAAAMFAAERILKPGGRLVVVSFHSLEDRIVKRFLAGRSKGQPQSRHLPVAQSGAPAFEPLHRGALLPGAAEIAANPRARSAKLRAARRTDAAAGDADPNLFRLADFSGAWRDLERSER